LYFLIIRIAEASSLTTLLLPGQDDNPGKTQVVKRSDGYPQPPSYFALSAAGALDLLKPFTSLAKFQNSKNTRW